MAKRKTKGSSYPRRQCAFKSQAKRDLLFGLLMAGISLKTAAPIVGVSRRTVEKERARNPEFDELFQDAKEIGKARLVGAVYSSAIAGNTKDAKWLLERLHGDEYGRKYQEREPNEQSRPNVVNIGSIPVVMIPDWYGKRTDPDQNVIEEGNSDGSGG